jgi:CRISPR system Cascade subunit CasD
MDILLLRFDAPLMSFGGAIVDQIGVTREYPARSMLTGLLANALGFSHGDFASLQRLQERLRYAVRCDRPGEPLLDFQTVDLGQEFLSQPGWTTRGEVQKRGGGEASKGTHIRYRRYIADAGYTVAVTLSPVNEEPSMDRVEKAFDEPERPLFLGRKPCIPSSTLLLARISAPNLVEALRLAPLWSRVSGLDGSLKAWWPEGEIEAPEDSREVYVTDERDWANQVHVSRRTLREGRVVPKEVSDEA